MRRQEEAAAIVGILTLCLSSATAGASDPAWRCPPCHRANAASEVAGPQLTANRYEPINIAPTLANLALLEAAIVEGGTVTLAGDIVDPDTPETFALAVDWADGSSETQSLGAEPVASGNVTWDPAARHFTVQHVYADNPPAGTTPGAYFVRVEVTDSDGAAPDIRVAAIGGNYGTAAADLIFAAGLLPGAVTRLYDTAAFNALTPAELRASFDVLLFTWGSDPDLDLDWHTRLLPYLELGGSVIVEDNHNYDDLAAIVSAYPAFSGPVVVSARVAGLTDGVAADDFVNYHVAFAEWAPALHPFLDALAPGNEVVGLYGAFGQGRLILTGTDLDYHGLPLDGGAPGNEAWLLRQELDWAARAIAVPVANQAPTLGALAVTPVAGAALNPSRIYAVNMVRLTGTFSDPGIRDTFALTVDWGDGAAADVVNYAADAARTLDLTHVYGALDAPPAPAPNVTISVAVTDKDGGTASASVDVRVVPPSACRHAPTGADHTVNAAASYVFAVTDFGFADPNDDPSDAFVGVVIATLPDAGALQLGSALLTAGAQVAVADLFAGNLVYVPPAELAATSFTFQVRDAGGSADGSADLDPLAKTMSLNPSAPPSRPIAYDQTVTVAAAETVAVHLQAASPDGRPLRYFIVTAPQQGVASLTDGGSTLAYTPAAGATGLDTLTFRVNDGTNDSNDAIVEVVVHGKSQRAAVQTTADAGDGCSMAAPQPGATALGWWLPLMLLLGTRSARIRAAIRGAAKP